MALYKEHATFVLEKKLAERVEELTIEEMGELFRTILDYANYETYHEFDDRFIRTIFKEVTQLIDLNDIKWHETRMKRIEGGKLGGRPPKNPGTNTDYF